MPYSYRKSRATGRFGAHVDALVEYGVHDARIVRARPVAGLWMPPEAGCESGWTIGWLQDGCYMQAVLGTGTSLQIPVSIAMIRLGTGAASLVVDP